MQNSQSGSNVNIAKSVSQETLSRLSFMLGGGAGGFGGKTIKISLPGKIFELIVSEDGGQSSILGPFPRVACNF